MKENGTIWKAGICRSVVHWIAPNETPPVPREGVIFRLCSRRVSLPPIFISSSRVSPKQTVCWEGGDVPDGLQGAVPVNKINFCRIYIYVYMYGLPRNVAERARRVPPRYFAPRCRHNRRQWRRPCVLTAEKTRCLLVGISLSGIGFSAVAASRWCRETKTEDENWKQSACFEEVRLQSERTRELAETSIFRSIKMFHENTNFLCQNWARVLDIPRRFASSTCLPL